MEYLKDAFALLLSGDRELLLIIRTTMIMSLFSTGISAILGLPLGVRIGLCEGKLRKILNRITGTLMSLPPVVAGLVVFMLFRSVGVFGSFRLMFTLPVMVVAQVLLITPVVAGLSCSSIGDKIRQMKETCTGLQIPKRKQILLLIKESIVPFISITLMGFGRSIAEVGAVSLVGGNIQYKTRVMTTAILLEANKGNFEKALILGIILLFISWIVNSIACRLQEKIK